MRVRTSTGVRPVSFYGHMNMSTTTDIEFASINADKVITELSEIITFYNGCM